MSRAVTVADRAAAVIDLLPRPLDPVRSVKLKISVLLLASGGAGLAYLYYEYGWQPPVGISLVTVAIVLLTAQVLAHGMTRPLRAMTAAARAMAQGDYSRRVRATSRDEVGQLAVAFQPDGRRPRRRRPAAPRADRERVPRAADADRRAAGGTGEPGRRRGHGRPGDALDRARPDPAPGQAGRRAARPVPDRRGRRGPRSRGLPGGGARGRDRGGSRGRGARGRARRGVHHRGPPGATRDCVLVTIGEGIVPPDDWRGTNLAREAARAELARLHPTCGTR